MTRLGRQAMSVLRVEPRLQDTTGITKLMKPRQRRFVHALRRARGGGDYVRTHAISQGWKHKVEALANGGEFTIYNDVPGVQFVEGVDQQPFLAALGWLYAPPILEKFMEEAEDIMTVNFVTAFDPFAGVPR